MQKQKLGIIVPYRDREDHLKYFVPSIKEYLDECGIPHSIYIIEQGNEKSFNRGKLLNVGYELFKDDCDYVCFHDVDIIPQDSSCDYSTVHRPTHLASRLSKFNYQLVYDEYFGGVTLFTKKHFELINGFSNEYWGWGYEDDDLLHRCKKRGVPLDIVRLGEYKDSDQQNKMVLQFIDKSYIKIVPSQILSDTFKNSFTIQLWLYPSHDLILNETDDYDEYYILFKKYFLNLSFTSGLQLKASILDKDGKEWMVVTPRLTEQWLHYVFTYDKESGRMSSFVNGVESTASPVTMGGLSVKQFKSFMYLGCGDPYTGETDNFKGYINQTSIWNKALKWGEIKSLFNNGNISVPTIKNQSYKSVENLVYSTNAEFVNDRKLDDVSGLKSESILTDVIQKNVNIKFGYTSLIPYRRDGKFTCLEHQESGWDNSKYVDFGSRENQLRFFNKVKRNIINLTKDGLSSLDYKVLQTDTFMGDCKYVKVDI
tara:strand:- start:251 stop:1699 length:1449 start_codon:yes stop_codon:yes gene_type:complete